MPNRASQVINNTRTALFYFAYASNLNRKQIASRAPGAKARYSAMLPNHKLIFAGWSRSWHGAVASILQSNGDRVNGGLYEVNERDLEQLAQYEGPEYSVTKVNVFRDTGEVINAVTFVQKQHKDEGRPSSEYLGTIKQGYMDWNLI